MFAADDFKCAQSDTRRFIAEFGESAFAWMEILKKNLDSAFALSVRVGGVATNVIISFLEGKSQ